MGRDLILFDALTGTMVMAHFLLESVETPQFFSVVVVYALIWMASLILLIWIRQYYREISWLDYDENLRRSHIHLIMLGVAAIYVVEAVVSSPFGGIYVPHILQFATATGIAASVLFNIVLIANAEEKMKLAGHLALYEYLKNNPYREQIAIVVPIAVWACLHGYISYVTYGYEMWLAILAAFLAGLILFYILKKSRSLLAAILCHAIFNSSVLILSQWAW